MLLFNECLWQPFLLVQEADLWDECKHYEILWFTLKFTYNLCFEAEKHISVRRGKPSGNYSFAPRFQPYFIIVFCHSVVTFTARFEIFSSPKNVFIHSQQFTWNYFFLCRKHRQLLLLCLKGEIVVKTKTRFGAESQCHHHNYYIVRNNLVEVRVEWEEKILKGNLHRWRNKNILIRLGDFIFTRNQLNLMRKAKKETYSPILYNLQTIRRVLTLENWPGDIRTLWNYRFE